MANIRWTIDAFLKLADEFSREGTKETAHAGMIWLETATAEIDFTLPDPPPAVIMRILNHVCLGSDEDVRMTGGIAALRTRPSKPADNFWSLGVQVSRPIDMGLIRRGVQLVREYEALTRLLAREAHALNWVSLCSSYGFMISPASEEADWFSALAALVETENLPSLDFGRWQSFLRFEDADMEFYTHQEFQEKLGWFIPDERGFPHAFFACGLTDILRLSELACHWFVERLQEMELSANPAATKVAIYAPGGPHCPDSKSSDEVSYEFAFAQSFCSLDRLIRGLQAERPAFDVNAYNDLLVAAERVRHRDDSWLYQGAYRAFRKSHDNSLALFGHEDMTSFHELVAQVTIETGRAIFAASGLPSRICTESEVQIAFSKPRILRKLVCAIERYHDWDSVDLRPMLLLEEAWVREVRRTGLLPTLQTESVEWIRYVSAVSECPTSDREFRSDVEDLQKVDSNVDPLATTKAYGEWAWSLLKDAETKFAKMTVMSEFSPEISADEVAAAKVHRNDEAWHPDFFQVNELQGMLKKRKMPWTKNTVTKYIRREQEKGRIDRFRNGPLRIRMDLFNELNPQ